MTGMHAALPAGSLNGAFALIERGPQAAPLAPSAQSGQCGSRRRHRCDSVHVRFLRTSPSGGHGFLFQQLAHRAGGHDLERRRGGPKQYIDQHPGNRSPSTPLESSRTDQSTISCRSHGSGRGQHVCGVFLDGSHAGWGHQTGPGGYQRIRQGLLRPGAGLQRPGPAGSGRAVRGRAELRSERGAFQHQPLYASGPAPASPRP